MEYWLNAKPENKEEFEQQVKEVCEVYHQATELEKAGIHTISTDEKTGIQALERAAETKPMRPGLIEKQEYEYERHGTLCLIANFDVVTGKIITPSLLATRTEEDFSAHIAQTIATDKDGGWVFIADNLNIHQSEALVRLIAKTCNITDPLGIKGKEGILKSMETRASFLSDPLHRIRFVYTPKHTSWLNQIEIWFSILVRRLLKRASFSSLDDLKNRILAFITYFNQTMAKPFKWTYKGRPLNV